MIRRIVACHLLYNLLRFTNSNNMGTVAIFVNAFTVAIVRLLTRRFTRMQHERDGLQHIVIDIGHLDTYLVRLLLNSVPFVRRPQRCSIAPHSNAVR